MEIEELRKVEEYLVKYAKDADYFPTDVPPPESLIRWLRRRFAELEHKEAR